MSRKAIVAAAVLATAIGAAWMLYNSEALKNARLVRSLIERNIEARGGIDAWQRVESLRLAGRMDLGRELVVPYALDQKRPGKMCLEFEFDGETSTQCTDGESGWKIAPFRGRSGPELMTETELRETADSADLYGLLYDHESRGIEITFAGHETIGGRDAYKLEASLPRGAVRWLYLDAETALEVKLETMRTIAGRKRRVETTYLDWQPTDEGLLIARRQETLTEGDAAPHYLTVDTVTVNPIIEDGRFALPRALSAAIGGRG